MVKIEILKINIIKKDEQELIESETFSKNHIFFIFVNFDINKSNIKK